METHKPYSRRHAEGLLKPCGNHWLIDERGVWPVVMDYNEAEGLGLVTEYKIMSWKPVTVFQDDQNSPDCQDTPALPFPFDAKDLAAFMLAGVGAFVAGYYGDWKDGPDEDAIASIDPGNNHARRAVHEAFDAYRAASKKAGRRDGELEVRADESRKRYMVARGAAIARNRLPEVPHRQPGDSDERSAELDAEYTRRLALVNSEVAEQEAEMTRLEAENQASERQWLRIMVSTLAGHTREPQAAAPACDLSILATRQQLIEAFGRFTDMDASWFQNVTDTPALLAARKVTGQGGRGHIAEPWFCPFEVMQWLADSKRRKGRKLSTEKAWELLEKNFPKVHSARSVADPRTGD